MKNNDKKAGLSVFFGHVAAAGRIIGTTASKLFDKIIYNRNASILVSILAAVIICVSVNYSELSSIFFNKEDTTLNLPAISVDVKMDSEKYAVTGLPGTVDMTVTGSPADIQVFRAQQQNISVMADLSGYGEGKNVVELRAMNVPDNLTVTVTPPSAEINLIRKETRTFNVKPELLLGSGQKVSDFETPELSEKRVKITATPDALNSIRVVKAYVDASGQTGDFTTTATISAYNAKGERVAVNTVPETVQATVKAVTDQ